MKSRLKNVVTGPRDSSPCFRLRAISLRELLITKEIGGQA